MSVIVFPGQGVQFKGMGKDLFAAYPAESRLASAILGYSVEELCVSDPEDRLRLTTYTQPAIYVVNALAYYRFLEEGGSNVTSLLYTAGHSLGEYNALLAANMITFENGLRLVKKRGALMGEARNGKMAAILGAKKDAVDALLAEYGEGEIEIANINTPTQYIVAGRAESLSRLEVACKKFGAQYILLNVSAAFHSRHMRDAHSEFARYLDRFEFAEPKLHVISNSTARPYLHINTGKTLGEQITTPVRWLESMQYLLSVGEENFIEIGPRQILTRMIDEIRRS